MQMLTQVVLAGSDLLLKFMLRLSVRAVLNCVLFYINEVMGSNDDAILMTVALHFDNSNGQYLT